MIAKLGNGMGLVTFHLMSVLEQKMGILYVLQKEHVTRPRNAVVLIAMKDAFAIIVHLWILRFRELDLHVNARMIAFVSKKLFQFKVYSEKM